jgi:acetylglutamate/LysW-gamma-L-alpha-aminoadipate kinase
MSSEARGGDLLVVKLGGGASIDADAVLDDVARQVGAGRRIVLVHGGGAAADRLGRRLGVPPRHATSASGVGSRLTDSVALEVVTMALVGEIKPRLVAGLVRRGVAAAGLSGLDAGTIRAARKAALRVRDGERVRVVRGDLSGRIVRVEPRLLRLLLSAGVLPVLSPPALGEDGPLNVDADRMAGMVAAALGAGELVFLSGIPGLLRDPADPATLVDRLGEGELAAVPWAQGRMRHKLAGARDALAGGVRRVLIASAAGHDPLRAALAGRGTVIEAVERAGSGEREDARCR